MKTVTARITEIENDERNNEVTLTIKVGVTYQTTQINEFHLGKVVLSQE
jgi:hypothetical protein